MSRIKKEFLDATDSLRICQSINDKSGQTTHFARKSFEITVRQHNSIQYEQQLHLPTHILEGWGPGQSLDEKGAHRRQTRSCEFANTRRNAHVTGQLPFGLLVYHSKILGLSKGTVPSHRSAVPDRSLDLEYNSVSHPAKLN